MATARQERLVYGYIRIESKPYSVPAEVSRLCLQWFIPIKTGRYLLRHHEIRLFEYLFPTKILGSSSYNISSKYNIIFEIKHKQTQKKYALKKYVMLFSHNNPYYAKQAIKDIKLMRHFNHPNIMHILDAIPPKPQQKDDFNDVYIIMPTMDANLVKFISEKKTSERHIQYIIYQILSGLHHIHECGVIHTEIRPKHIMININNLQVRITDFGKAVRTNTAKMKEYNGPRTCEYIMDFWYESPEMRLGDNIMTDKVDIWGVGCITAELYLKRMLFYGNNYPHHLKVIFNILGIPTDISWIKDEKAKEWILKQPQTEPQDLNEIIPGSSKLAQDFMMVLLTLNPNKRVDAVTAMNHKWLKEFGKQSKEDYDVTLFDFSNEEEDDISVIRESVYNEMIGIYQVAPQQLLSFKQQT